MSRPNLKNPSPKLLELRDPTKNVGLRPNKVPQILRSETNSYLTKLRKFVKDEPASIENPPISKRNDNTLPNIEMHASSLLQGLKGSKNSSQAPQNVPKDDSHIVSECTNQNSTRQINTRTHNKTAPGKPQERVEAKGEHAATRRTPLSNPP